MLNNILVISPYAYALENKVMDVKLRLLSDNNDDSDVCAIKALPYEVSEKLYGRSFDFAYVDNHYIDREIADIRTHITGDQHKNIKFF